MSFFKRDKGFKDIYSLKERENESRRILCKYPSYVPVIVELDKKLGELQKQKFLVPGDVCMSHLLFSVRKHIKNMNQSTALFIFVDGSIISPTQMLNVVYDTYKKNKKDETGDLFLYVNIAAENTFG